MVPGSGTACGLYSRIGMAMFVLPVKVRKSLPKSGVFAFVGAVWLALR